MTFESFEAADAAPWLQGPNGLAWNTALGQMKDEYIARAKAAVKTRWPQSAPSDALDLIGSNFQIDRGFSPDDASFIAFLEDAWTLWGEAGRKPGLIRALADAGITNFAVWENWQWLGGDVHPDRWWQFWITIHPPFPWPTTALADGTWADVGTWADAGTWAESIPWNDYLRLQALVKKWKPSHAHCVNVILVHTGSAFGDLGTLTWDGASLAGVTWDGNITTDLDA